MEIIGIYDNNGESLDRYTVVFDEEVMVPSKGKLNMGLALSEDSTHPQKGVSMFVECLPGEHLGNEIRFEELPEDIQLHVWERIKE